jgi:hypothetical protein
MHMHLQAVADRLGLRRHPLQSGGVISTIMYQGTPTPAEVLDEPLTVQLLAGPGNVALEVTIPAVLVLPLHSESDNQFFELQLGLFDFCAAVEVDWLPLWASQFTDRQAGECFAVPVVAPRPPQIHMRLLGTSTFHITQEAYEEVRDSSGQTWSNTVKLGQTWPNMVNHVQTLSNTGYQA